MVRPAVTSKAIGHPQYWSHEYSDYSQGCPSGGGGSSGSATLDRLMEQIPFGPKPKIVDLTSDRKLADKVL